MSHLFDTPTGRDDPRLKPCDLYLCGDTFETTVMVMIVKSATTAARAALSGDEGLYVFDTVGNTPEDVSFKARCGAAVDRDGSEGR